MRTGKIGAKEIRIIHTAVNHLMMNDKEYREILKDFGVTTSKELSFRQYERLLNRFRADGFILTTKEVSRHRQLPKPTWEKEPMLKKISALLAEMKLAWAYADSIARHMFKVDSTLWCTPAQLHSVIAALEYKRRKFAEEKRHCQ